MVRHHARHRTHRCRADDAALVNNWDDMRKLEPAVGERIRKALEQMAHSGKLEQLLRMWDQ
jgi:hypothetical protein